MSEQTSFAGLAWTTKGRMTRRERFLAEMDQVIPCDGFTAWLDEEDILPGEAWQPAIERAVRSSHVVLVCLSAGSTSKAGLLQKEIRSALEIAEEQPEGTIFIIPLKLEEVDVPSQLSRWQWLNYYEDAAHDRLVKALRRRASQLVM